METPATADSPTTAAPSPRVRIARLTAYRRSDALAALTEACRPYGSLSAEVPALMLDWACGTRRAGYPPGAESLCEEINCDDPHRLDVASLLLAAIRGVDTSESSDLTLGDFTAAVCTPTSGTVIGVRRFAGGVDVTVDFGPDGSARRGADLVASKRWQIEYVDPAATARVSIR